MHMLACAARAAFQVQEQLRAAPAWMGSVRWHGGRHREEGVLAAAAALASGPTRPGSRVLHQAPTLTGRGEAQHPLPHSCVGCGSVRKSGRGVPGARGSRGATAPPCPCGPLAPRIGLRACRNPSPAQLSCPPGHITPRPAALRWPAPFGMVRPGVCSLGRSPNPVRAVGGPPPRASRTVDLCARSFHPPCPYMSDAMPVASSAAPVAANLCLHEALSPHSCTAMNPLFLQ